jgi:lactoylglutathione lyase
MNPTRRVSTPNAQPPTPKQLPTPKQRPIRDSRGAFTRRLPALGLVVTLGIVASPSAAPARPSIFGIANVRVLTADLAQARRFYAGVLGLSALRWDPRAGVAVFSVNPRQRLIVTNRTPVERATPFVDVAFDTADVGAMRDWLASRGVTTPPPVPDFEAGGQALKLTDPDGHDVLLVEEHAPHTLSTPTVSDYPVSKQILHAGLLVSDPGAADRFYRDVLGFSEIWRGGRTTKAIDWINMRVPDGTDYLEYMLTPASGRRPLVVDHHIALMVPDIHVALEQVRARTPQFDVNHVATPQAGRTGQLQLNLFDPDGTRIELAEPERARASIPKFPLPIPN